MHSRRVFLRHGSAEQLLDLNSPILRIEVPTMFRLSKLTDYSTVIMSYMAREPGDINSVAAMAVALDIAAPTVSKILKMLAQRGLVRATRGAKGGYRLSRM